MDEKQVSKALFKKLSALRATLSDEEQAMLDQMVTGEFDVEGHRLRAHGVTAGRAAREEDEVAAHKLSAAGATAARAMEEDEVAAHKMSVARVVVYNPDEEAYDVEFRTISIR